MKDFPIIHMKENPSKNENRNEGFLFKFLMKFQKEFIKENAISHSKLGTVQQFCSSLGCKSVVLSLNFRVWKPEI